MERIVIYGAPLAGKTTIMRAAIQAHAGRAVSFRVPSDGSSDVGLRVTFGQPTCELITFPGTVWSQHVWTKACGAANAVLLAIEPERPELALESVRWLDSLQTCPGIGSVVLTKSDKAPANDYAADMLRGTRFEPWPVFVSRMDQPESLVQPVDWLRDRLAHATP